MRTETVILEMLKSMYLDAYTVMSVKELTDGTRVTFTYGPSLVSCVMTLDYEVVVESVVYENQMFQDKQNLEKFQPAAFEVLSKVLFAKKRIARLAVTSGSNAISVSQNAQTEQVRMEAIKQREAKIKEMELQLTHKEEQMKSFEALLLQKEKEMLIQRDAPKVALAAKQLENRQKIEDKMRKLVPKPFRKTDSE